jgi:hypothetical protein
MTTAFEDQTVSAEDLERFRSFLDQAEFFARWRQSVLRGKAPSDLRSDFTAVAPRDGRESINARRLLDVAFAHYENAHYPCVAMPLLFAEGASQLVEVAANYLFGSEFWRVADRIFANWTQISPQLGNKGLFQTLSTVFNYFDQEKGPLF